MPEDDYVWLPREDVIDFEETSALADIFLALGVDKTRLTGREPQMRRDVAALVGLIASKQGLRDLALTTNGVMLADQIDALKAAGLGRITVSLDTLHRDRFKALTRFDQLDAVHDGIAAARRVFGGLKIDTVVIRGVNDDELISLIEYGRTVNSEIRFIEYMDVGNTNGWRMDDVVNAAEIIRAVDQHWPLEPIAPNYAGEVAGRWRYKDGGGEIGIIASVTQAFCASCTRARLSAEGQLYTCLFSGSGHDLRSLMRQERSDDEIKDSIRSVWR